MVQGVQEGQREKVSYHHTSALSWVLSCSVLSLSARTHQPVRPFPSKSTERGRWSARPSLPFLSIVASIIPPGRRGRVPGRLVVARRLTTQKRRITYPKHYHTFGSLVLPACPRLTSRFPPHTPTQSSFSDPAMRNPNPPCMSIP